MATTKMPLTQRPAWKALQSHYRDIRGQHLRHWFAEDPTRGERLTAEAVGIYLDYSKNRVTDETLRLLIELAEQSGLHGRLEAMFRGEKINVTENRAVLHVALRAAGGNHPRGRRERGAPGTRRARQDGGLLRPRPVRRLEGPHRQAHPQCHQHRHRRLRPRAGDGLRGTEKLNGLPAGHQVMLKLTLPEQSDFYADLVRHPRVVRVVALSGGYTREEADDRLRKNHGVAASFSRALLDGLSVHQTDAEFNAMLDASIESIYEASIT